MGELRRTIVELDPDQFSWSKSRTPGLHLTDVIRDMLEAAGQIKARDGWTAEQSRRAWVQGFVWEDLFTERLQYKLAQSPATFNVTEYARVGEIAVRLDGGDAFLIDPATVQRNIECGEPAVPLGYIIMSPDGVRFSPYRLMEMKWTMLSINTDPEKARPDFFYQALGYLKGLQIVSGQVNDVEWHVQHACGDYKGSGPVYQRWDRHFGDAEIEDNWMMLRCHVLDRIKARQHGTGTGTTPHRWAQWITGQKAA